MRITNTLFKELRKHCTIELLSLVGVIEPKDDEENIWDITDIIQNGKHLYEQLRVAYAFEQLGGVLVYNEKPTQFVIISKCLPYLLRRKSRTIHPSAPFGSVEGPAGSAGWAHSCSVRNLPLSVSTKKGQEGHLRFGAQS